jgi:hypothetical protein
MTWDFLIFCFLCVAVVGYNSLVVYYWLGSMLSRDLLWRTFSKEMLPGMVLAAFTSLMLFAFWMLADLMGYTTIWWPNVPVL